MGETLTRDEAVEKLAERLFSYLEKLDSTDGGSWGDLPENCHYKRLYRLAIADLVLFHDLIAAAQRLGPLREYNHSALPPNSIS